MKIAHVVLNYHPSIGGTQIFYKGISENCIKIYDDEVEVLTVDSYFGSHSSQYKKITPLQEIVNGVNVKRFPFYRKHRYYFSILHKIFIKLTGKKSQLLSQYLVGPWSPSLKRAIDTTDADIISASSSTFMYMLYPLYRHKLKNPKPFVFQGAIHFADQKHDSVVSNKILQAIKASEYYMSNTEYEKRSLIALGVDADMIVVTGTAVDMELFEKGDGEFFRSKNSIADDEILIGYIGRLEATKSIDVLVKAFMKSYDTNNKIRLVIAGYESMFIIQLRTYIDSLDTKYKSNIFFQFNLEINEKVNLYNALDIFILPSVNESFGIVFLEAWSCRKPVIGAAVGAVASVISDGIDGLLMKPHDVDSLTEKILLLAFDKNLRGTLGSNGYIKTKNNFTWDIVAKKYRETYTLAIEKFKSKLNSIKV